MFAKLAQPLYDLLRKDVEWDWPGLKNIYREAFNLIKARFSEFPFLRMADIERPFLLKPDACKTAVGYILGQHDDSNVEYMVETDSRVLTPAEQLYSIYELEMLAYIFGITKCRQYLDGVHFTCLTDHEALTWFDSIRHLLTKHRLRWYLTAQCFDCTFIHRPGVLHTDADAVSRIYSHTPTPAIMPLPTKENPFKFKKSFLDSNKELDFLKPFCEIDHVQKMGRQLVLLERISQTTDPWEDINLFKYIKSGYHEKILSARKTRQKNTVCV